MSGRDRKRNRSVISSVGTAKKGRFEKKVKLDGKDRSSRTGLEELGTTGIMDWLEEDPSPVLIIDLSVKQDGTEQDLLDPAFVNRALRLSSHLCAALEAKPQDDILTSAFISSYTKFARWANLADSKDGRERGENSLQHSFGGIPWTQYTVRGRWRVITAHEVSDTPVQPSRPPLPTPDPSRDSMPSPMLESSRNANSASDSSYPVEKLSQPSGLMRNDWTQPDYTGEMSDHIRFARSIDWSKTALGALSDWPSELRQLANALMAAPYLATLFWGEDLSMIYNERYRDLIAGGKDSPMLGSSFPAQFADNWTQVKGIFEECRRTGKAVDNPDQMLPIERDGIFEETYFSWSLTPIFAGSTEVQGFWCVSFETTRLQVSDRRTKSLLKLGEEMAMAQNISAVWEQILKGLEANHHDFPFVLLYSLPNDIDSGSDGGLAEPRLDHLCHFEGALGVAPGHSAAPEILDLKAGPQGYIPYVLEALHTLQPVRMLINEDHVPKSRLDGIQWRGWGEACRDITVLPIRPTDAQQALGFLVIGLNPRRPYDEDYRVFMSLLDRQLSTSLASAILIEEEKRRGLTAAQTATIERRRLSEQLAAETNRFRRMVDLCTVGMFFINPEGLLLEANDKWYEITQHPRVASNMSWMNVFDPESVPIMEAGWDELVVQKKPWSAELKLIPKMTDPATGDIIDRWIIASSVPELDQKGNLLSVMGSITDISLQKYSTKNAEARAQLSEQLLTKTEEVRTSEARLATFAEMMPNGMNIFKPSGEIVYCNPAWWELTQYVDEGDPTGWFKCFYPEDLEAAGAVFKKLTEEKVQVIFEIRLAHPWTSPDGEASTDFTWVLCAAAPELDEDGEIRTLLGCMTNISQQKWAEDVQSRRVQEAEEMRAQQNNFIDMTSHEMRNPMSAILQCAEDISLTLESYRNATHLGTDLVSAIESCMDSAATICLCAQHQKSIVDDILTLSKLSSNLALVTPMSSQPAELVRRVQRMFDAEMRSNGILLRVEIGESYSRLDVDYVFLDPSRVLQILINLITNAIKFTKTQAKRVITMRLNAFVEPPHATETGVDYVPAKLPIVDPVVGEEWGVGQPLYIVFDVDDTGCGLNSDERKLLFYRFSQSSPRTHIKYGGSGLGLYISRQLTELHGGRIGVQSSVGEGSTFSFYIKVRRHDLQSITMSRMDGADELATSILATGLKPASQTSTRPTSGYSTPTRSMPLTPQLRSIHILIVEDNLVNQKVLTKQLQKLGWVISIANHGVEALEHLEKTEIWTTNRGAGKQLDAILMDQEMPVMGGLACTKRIRELEGQKKITKHIPVIAITANAREEQMKTAMAHGMDHVLTKPFRIPELVTTVERFLHR